MNKPIEVGARVEVLPQELLNIMIAGKDWSGFQSIVVSPSPVNPGYWTLAGAEGYSFHSISLRRLDDFPPPEEDSEPVFVEKKLTIGDHQ